MKLQLLGLLAACATLEVTGCTLYTAREYGPQERSTVIVNNAGFGEIVKTLGAPDFIHQMAAGSSICVYHSLNYRNFVSVYAETHKDDLVLTFVGDRLTDIKWVTRGMTMSIIAGQTHELGVNIND